ncbi:MAG TPA: fumarylacetoacetate hydrolase family protein [Polyangiaceae bacterium]|nr:fumarylacetoacetate hydrolase family protein [Polyangiaceae bacterium]
MKLMRLGERGKERPAVFLSDREAFDLSAIVRDYDPEFFAGTGQERVREAVKRGDLPKIDLEKTRIGAPVARPGKFMAVALNYVDHAKETGAPIPERPIFFDKASSSINGPYDDVVLPSNYDTVDYEIELAFVVGRTAKRVSREAALGHVAGYLICNDVSERTAQKKEGGQWYRGKSFDTFAPIGPWLVTPDELGNPHDLGLVCRVDGQVRQDGHTSQLIFDLPHLIAFITRNITLEPGDIVTTGTPAGVAMGMTPPAYLADGQVMELEVTGLGKQRSRLIRED